MPTCTREEGAMKPVEQSLAWLRFFTCLVIRVFVPIPNGMAADEFLAATTTVVESHPKLCNFVLLLLLVLLLVSY